MASQKQKQKRHVTLLIECDLYALAATRAKCLRLPTGNYITSLLLADMQASTGPQFGQQQRTAPRSSY